MNPEFLKTPKEKAEHADTQFGTDSLYARALHILAKLVGENPTVKKIREHLPAVERWVEFKLQEKMKQKKEERTNV